MTTFKNHPTNRVANRISLNKYINIVTVLLLYCYRFILLIELLSRYN